MARRDVKDGITVTLESTAPCCIGLREKEAHERWIQESQARVDLSQRFRIT